MNKNMKTEVDLTPAFETIRYVVREAMIIIIRRSKLNSYNRYYLLVVIILIVALS